MLALALPLLVLPLAAPVDLIPPGHRGIVHELVFVDSPLLADRSLMATPIAGFSGVHIVVPGEPFRFSTKYGTKLYLVPRGTEVESPRAGAPLPFPRSAPPVSEVRSVPLVSPVHSILTTCELVEVDGDALRIEVVDHVQLGFDGQPASATIRYVLLGAVLAAGIAMSAVLWRRRRRGAAA